MIKKHLAKISFSVALAAVFSLGFIGLASQPAEAVPTCPARVCSGTILSYGLSCLYFEPVTQCDFRCSIATDNWGSCRTRCSPEAL